MVLRNRSYLAVGWGGVGLGTNDLRSKAKEGGGPQSSKCSGGTGNTVSRSVLRWGIGREAEGVPRQGSAVD